LVNLKLVETWEEYEELIQLELREEQKDAKAFLPSNLQSFADAFVWQLTTGSAPLLYGVYHGDTPVGFVMLNHSEPENQYDSFRVDGAKESVYYLWRLMIDKNHQGKGYGKAALQSVIEHVRTTKPFGAASWLYTSVQPYNPAFGLYLSVGFEDTGGTDGNKNDLRIKI